jgi:hypothetical protein
VLLKASLLVCLFTAAHILVPRVLPLDDSYIYLHSADVLRNGIDPIYGAPAFAGITSPVFLAMLAGLEWMGLEPISALRTLTAGGLAGFAAMAWRLTSLARIQSTTARLLMVFGAIVSGCSFVDLTNGLETGWAAAILAALIGCAASGEVNRAAMLAALLPLFRPDLGPVALIAGGAVLPAAHGAAVRVRACVLAVVVTIPWLLWVHANTGAWLPQAMQAKAVFFAEGCNRVGWKAMALSRTWIEATGAFLPVSLGLPLLWWAPKGRALVVGVAVVLIGYFVLFPTAALHNDYRYAAALLVPLGFWGLSSAIGSRARTAREATVAAMMFASVAVVTFRAPDLRYGAELVETARWINEHVPPDAVLLVHDAGAVSVLSSNPIVDIVGLKSPESLAIHKTTTWTSCGARRADAFAEIARESRSSYLVVVADWERIFHISNALTERGFRLDLLRRPPATVDNGFFVYAITKQ